jgi:hypothetical protein
MNARRLRCAAWAAAIVAACGCGETSSDGSPWPPVALLQEADYEHTDAAAVSADGSAVSV